VYRLVFDRETGMQLAKELILANHSKVLYDPALIPKEQIRNADH
jgi:vancomycin resistance protein VanW